MRWRAAFRIAWRVCLPVAGWYLRHGHLYLLRPRTADGLVRRLMESLQSLQPTAPTSSEAANGAHPAAEDAAAERKPEQRPPARLVILVRHGETTYNVERRLPGQLAGVALTDEGRRQAQRAAVALSGLPISAVIASPLERARETAEILARGWALPVRTDPQLMDTDVGSWSGALVDDLNKNDPAWKAFVEHPNQPPAGVEGFEAVRARAVAAVDDALKDATTGNYLVLVAHADIIKLILAHYTAMETEAARFIAIGNCAISALAFTGEAMPHLLAINWTAAPGWLMPPPLAAAQAAAQPAVQASSQTPGGAVAPAPTSAETASPQPPVRSE
jgi:broad specificity phosphatase PhoE